MIGRGLLVCGAIAANAVAGFAQFPPARQPAPFTPRPQSAAPLSIPQPPSALPTPPTLPDGSVVPASRVETVLPREETKFAIDSAALSAKKINGVWQIWMGQQAVRIVGNDEAGAKDIVRLMQDQRPTDWVAIGSPRPVVEYGLVSGRPSANTGLPKAVVNIDLRSVRLEPLKGVWCLRDDANILFNFGLNKSDAEQALGVVRKYGFNRIGMMGDITNPAMTYFFVAVEAEDAKPAKKTIATAFQEQNLNRTGIPLPGLGYVGEMVRIDSRKAELRREGADWVVACGNDAIAKFGQDQSAARDALRMIQEGQFTEFGKAGPAGANFFLSNGQVPTRWPLNLQNRRIDTTGLKVVQAGGAWSVTERGRNLFDVSSAEEGEAVLRLIKVYGFDQVCKLGSSPKANLTFLAKGR